jgi:CBS domain-containing protein
VSARKPIFPEAMQRMLDARAERLIILDELGRPVGVVSASDMLVASAEHMHELAEPRSQRTVALRPK